MSTISDFTSNFSIGSRSNLYKIEIDGINQKLEFTCKAAQLPGKTINPIEVKYLSNTIKVPGDAVFEDWTVTVLNDEDFIIRQQIDTWMEDIKANSNATGQGNFGYFREARVIPINRDGSENTDGSYKLINLWPTSVEPMELGFDNSDTILEFGVTFSYTHWEKI